jgi:hypothetical protein
MTPSSTVQPKILEALTNKISLVRVSPLTHYKSMFWMYNSKKVMIWFKKRVLDNMFAHNVVVVGKNLYIV